MYQDDTLPEDARNGCLPMSTPETRQRRFTDREGTERPFQTS